MHVSLGVLYTRYVWTFHCANIHSELFSETPPESTKRFSDIRLPRGRDRFPRSLLTPLTLFQVFVICVSKCGTIWLWNFSIRNYFNNNGEISGCVSFLGWKILTLSESIYNVHEIELISENIDWYFYVFWNNVTVEAISYLLEHPMH